MRSVSPVPLSWPSVRARGISRKDMQLPTAPTRPLWSCSDPLNMALTYPLLTTTAMLLSGREDWEEGRRSNNLNERCWLTAAASLCQEGCVKYRWKQGRDKKEREKLRVPAKNGVLIWGRRAGSYHRSPFPSYLPFLVYRPNASLSPSSSFPLTPSFFPPFSTL